MSTPQTTGSGHGDRPSSPASGAPGMYRTYGQLGRGVRVALVLGAVLWVVAAFVIDYVASSIWGGP